jgi:hypothetical protein
MRTRRKQVCFEHAWIGGLSLSLPGSIPQPMPNPTNHQFEHLTHPPDLSCVNEIALCRNVEATWDRMFFALFRFQRGRGKGKTMALRHQLVKELRREAISFTTWK